MRIGTAAMMAALGAVLAVPAAARSKADKTATSSRVVDDLLACKSFAAPDARLACFDRTASALDTARANREVVVLDREGARKVKRTVFGFALPRIKLFGGDDSDEPEVTEIESTLTRVDELGYGNYRYVLADNSVWQTTEELSGAAPRRDQPVKIKAGILGSYIATVAKGRAVKVKRLR